MTVVIKITDEEKTWELPLSEDSQEAISRMLRNLSDEFDRLVSQHEAARQI